MSEQIDFLREKMDKANELYLHYSAMSDLSCFEEFNMDAAKKEVENYAHIITIVKAYNRYMTNGPQLKKAQ